MDSVKERLLTAKNALGAFQELVDLPDPSDVERDAAIQRFEFTYEMAWKATRFYLREFEKIDVSSPRKVIRTSFQVDLLDEDEARLALSMAEDRNKTVHTYDEEFAKKFYKRLSEYSELITKWLNKMEERLKPEEEE